MTLSRADWCCRHCRCLKWPETRTIALFSSSASCALRVHLLSLSRPVHAEDVASRCDARRPRGHDFRRGLVLAHRERDAASDDGFRHTRFDNERRRLVALESAVGLDRAPIGFELAGAGQVRAGLLQQALARRLLARCVAVANAPIYAAGIPRVKSFVKRKGTQLLLNGRRFVPVGVNAYCASPAAPSTLLIAQGSAWTRTCLRRTRSATRASSASASSTRSTARWAATPCGRRASGSASAAVRQAVLAGAHRTDWTMHPYLDIFNEQAFRVADCPLRASTRR